MLPFENRRGQEAPAMYKEHYKIVHRDLSVRGSRFKDEYVESARTDEKSLKTRKLLPV